MIEFDDEDQESIRILPVERSVSFKFNLISYACRSRGKGCRWFEWQRVDVTVDIRTRLQVFSALDDNHDEMKSQYDSE